MLDRGGFSRADVRGANMFFVKNGAKVRPSGPASLVFHEPYAQVWLENGERAEQIAVSAIRPSYVKNLIKIAPAN